MNKNPTKVVLHTEAAGINITVMTPLNLGWFASKTMLKIVDEIDAWDIKKIAKEIKVETKPPKSEEVVFEHGLTEDGLQWISDFLRELPIYDTQARKDYVIRKFKDEGAEIIRIILHDVFPKEKS